MLHEFKLGTMPLKLLPITTEHGEMHVQVIGQYKGAYSNSVDQSLDDEKKRGWVCSLDNEQLQAIISNF